MPIYTDRWFDVNTPDTTTYSPTTYSPTTYSPTTYSPTTTEIITVIKDIYIQSRPVSTINQNFHELIEACISAK